MKINLFSVDLKLVDADDPARRSFRVLEFNDGLRSGFTGYDALGGEKMVSDVIRKDYEALFPEYQVVDLNVNAYQNDGRRVIMLPRTDRLTVHQSRMDMIAAQRMKDVYITPNSDLHMRMLSENKAYQSYLSEKIGASRSLFPPTVILPSAWNDARGDFEKIKECAEGYVMKPLSLLGGTGVRLIDAHRLEKDVSAYLSRKRYRQGDNWIGMNDPACLVQHKVAASKVETEDGTYDGTMRVAFTVYGEEGEDLQCHVHDAYWKLPQFTMEEMKGPKSVISFSPSNGEPNSNILSRLFSLATLHSGIKSEEVGADVKSWLFPQLAKDFAGYFTGISRMDYLENTCALLKQESKGLQGLGLMMATHPVFYPGGNASETDVHYPARLVDSLASSAIATDRSGILHQHLLNALQDAPNFMHCEDVQKEFCEPLHPVLRQNALQNMVHMIMQVAYKM